MGTRGWVVLLHKGVYYRIFHSSDSDFGELGVCLINTLNDGGDAFLVALRKLLDLGNVMNCERLVPPVETQPRMEWGEAIVSLPNGCISDWFCSDMILARHDPPFLIGDGMFLLSTSTLSISIGSASTPPMISIRSSSSMKSKVFVRSSWSGHLTA